MKLWVSTIFRVSDQQFWSYFMLSSIEKSGIPFFLEHHSLCPKDFHEINFHLFEKYVADLSWQELEEFSALLYRLNIGKTFSPILLKKIFTINASEKSRARFFWKLHKFWILLKLEFGQSWQLGIFHKLEAWKICKVLSASLVEFHILRQSFWISSSLTWHLEKSIWIFPELEPGALVPIFQKA